MSQHEIGTIAGASTPRSPARRGPARLARHSGQRLLGREADRVQACSHQQHDNAGDDPDCCRWRSRSARAAGARPRYQVLASRAGNRTRPAGSRRPCRQRPGVTGRPRRVLEMIGRERACRAARAAPRHPKAVGVDARRGGMAARGLEDAVRRSGENAIRFAEGVDDVGQAPPATRGMISRQIVHIRIGTPLVLGRQRMRGEQRPARQRAARVRARVRPAAVSSRPR